MGCPRQGAALSDRMPSQDVTRGRAHVANLDTGAGSVLLPEAIPPAVAVGGHFAGETVARPEGSERAVQTLPIAGVAELVQALHAA